MVIHKIWPLTPILLLSFATQPLLLFFLFSLQLKKLWVVLQLSKNLYHLVHGFQTCPNTNTRIAACPSSTCGVDSKHISTTLAAARPLLVVCSANEYILLPSTLGTGDQSGQDPLSKNAGVQPLVNDVCHGFQPVIVNPLAVDCSHTSRFMAHRDIAGRLVLAAVGYRAERTA